MRFSKLACLTVAIAALMVEAEVRSALQGWQVWLGKNAASGNDAASRMEASRLIGKYLADPKSVKLRSLTVIPLGAPI